MRNNLPRVQDLSEFVATLDRHPFGALSLLLLAALVVLAIWVWKHSAPNGPGHPK